MRILKNVVHSCIVGTQRTFILMHTVCIVKNNYLHHCKCSELTLLLTNIYETLHGKVKLIYFHLENDCLELLLIVIPQR